MKLRILLKKIKIFTLWICFHTIFFGQELFPQPVHAACRGAGRGVGNALPTILVLPTACLVSTCPVSEMYRALMLNLCSILPFGYESQNYPASVDMWRTSCRFDQTDLDKYLINLFYLEEYFYLEKEYLREILLLFF